MNGIQNSTRNTFKRSLLQFIKPSPNILSSFHNPESIKYVRLRLGLSHLQEDKFKHSPQNTLNPF